MRAFWRRRRHRRSTSARYFARVDETGGQREIVRITPAGAASFFEPVSQTWVHDPLLAAEVLTDPAWERITDISLLPSGKRRRNGGAG